MSLMMPQILKFADSQKSQISWKGNIFSSNELDHYLYMKDYNMAEK